MAKITSKQLSRSQLISMINSLRGELIGIVSCPLDELDMDDIVNAKIALDTTTFTVDEDDLVEAIDWRRFDSSWLDEYWNE